MSIIAKMAAIVFGVLIILCAEPAPRCGFASELDTTAETSTAYHKAMDSITIADLKRHVDYLADDELQGRKPGTPGGRAAGAYIAEAFEQFDLLPGDSWSAAENMGSRSGYFQSFRRKYRNVLAALAGSDETLKREVVVVGAHYDHLGCDVDVYNGADDNASGTSALLELAEACAMLPQSPRRTLLFAAWDGEESGLVGSTHWMRHGAIGNGRVVFMINMDMIGRLRDRQLYVYASRSGYGLRRLVSTLNSDLTLAFPEAVKRRSDHWPFYKAGIPVMLFNTGRHDQMHTHGDDASFIDHKGMRSVARLIFETIIALADADDMPRFRPTSYSEVKGRTENAAGQVAAFILERFGASWQADYGEEDGVCLSYVYPQKAADRASLQPGDRVISFAGRVVQDEDDMQTAVLTAASPANITIRRHGQAKPLVLSVDLGGRPLRLGFFWREDDAEPGTVILTHVVPDTPAARAGLVAGDRIYSVNGATFANDEEFRNHIRNAKGSLKMRVERHGKIREVNVWPQDVVTKQAA